LLVGSVIADAFLVVSKLETSEVNGEFGTWFNAEVSYGVLNEVFFQILSNKGVETRGEVGSFLGFAREVFPSGPFSSNGDAVLVVNPLVIEGVMHETCRSKGKFLLDTVPVTRGEVAYNVNPNVTDSEFDHQFQCSCSKLAPYKMHKVLSSPDGYRLSGTIALGSRLRIWSISTRR